MHVHPEAKSRAESSEAFGGVDTAPFVHVAVDYVNRSQSHGWREVRGLNDTHICTQRYPHFLTHLCHSLDADARVLKVLQIQRLQPPTSPQRLMYRPNGIGVH